MKSKQLRPKSVRPLSNHNPSHKSPRSRVRCSLCDALLKASSTHRYLLMGKSVHDQLNTTMTYAQCCSRYLNGCYELEKLHMLCPKCCQDLQRVYALHNDAEQLVERIRHTWHKTKRLNRTRVTPLSFARAEQSHSSSPFSTAVTDENVNISIKEELEIDDGATEIRKPVEQPIITISETVLANRPYDLSYSQCLPKESYPVKFAPKLTPGPKARQGVQSRPKAVHSQLPKSKKPHLMDSYPSFLPTQTSQQSTFPTGQEFYTKLSYPPSMRTASPSPFAQLMIDSPQSSSSPMQRSNVRSRSSSTSEQLPLATPFEGSLDEDQSISPGTNEDDTSLINEPKSARLSRRQYNFLVKLPDQQSLNTFIETSSAESGSRWTWRRTSANSRGYKVYYVCNFSMRRHYHPCPAAMYALFHPEGSISIYSCGQHQHIPKDRLPVSITDATKDEIFKCLQAGMATTEIRERLTLLKLPFGDTRKLNNFIKYHKELLRFGTVTNVRIGGTAYRQPQCWAIRRQPGVSSPPVTNSNDEKTVSGDNEVV